MKKNNTIIFVLICLTFVCALASCKSTKIEPSVCSPTAIVSIYGNSSLPWFVPLDKMQSDDDNEGGGMLSGLVNRALGTKDPEIQTVDSRIDNAAEMFAKMVEDKLGIDVVEHSVLEQSKMYQKNSSSFLASVGDNVPAEGFKVIETSGSKFNKMVEKETGTKSLMFVNFMFYKEKDYVGITDINAFARTRMTVRVVDSRGRNIWKKQYSATSRTGVDYRNGKWDKEKLCTLYPEVVESVINQFIVDFKGESLEKDLIDEPAVDSQEEEPFISTEEAVPIAIPSSVKQNNDESETSTDSEITE